MISLRRTGSIGDSENSMKIEQYLRIILETKSPYCFDSSYVDTMCLRRLEQNLFVISLIFAITASFSVGVIF